jgi:hypothetical protein
LDQYRSVRDQLNFYAEIVATVYGRTGLTIYQVISQALRLAPRLNDAREPYRNPRELDVFKALSETEAQEIVKIGQNLEKAFIKASDGHPAWFGANWDYHSRAALDHILDLAQKAGDEFALVAATRTELGEELAAWPVAKLKEAREVFQRAREEASWSLGLLRKAIDYLAAAGGVYRGLDYGLANYALADLLEFRRFINELVGRNVALEPRVLAGLAQSCLFEHAKYYYQTAGPYNESLLALKKVLVDLGRADNATVLAELIAVGTANALTDLSPAKLAAELARDEDELLPSRLLDDRLGALVAEGPEFARVPFATFNAIKGLLAKTPSEVKGHKFQDDSPEAIRALKDFNEVGLTLNERRTQISEKLDPEVDLEPAEIRELVQVFLTAGFFKFLSPAYRRAKRLYLTLVKDPSVSPLDLIRELKDLADWRDKTKNFVRDPKVKVAYGESFKGLGTDFAFFKKVVAFLEDLERARAQRRASPRQKKDCWPPNRAL